MSVEHIRLYFMEYGDDIKSTIRNRNYKPNPDGGISLLVIPTVLDRVNQKSINQVLSIIFEKQFSYLSFGFRPNRSC